MRNFFIKVFTMAVFLVAVNSSWAVVISLEPASQQAAPGDTVSLDLIISGLNAGGPDSLGDFDLDIGYDAAALSFSSYTMGNFLGDLALNEALDFSLGDSGGLINLAEVSLLDADNASGPAFVGPYLDDIQPAAFTLATLDFMVDVLAEGNFTVVSIDSVFAVGDGFGLPLELDSTRNAVIRNGVPMPEPASILLFVIGLMAFSVRRSIWS